MIDCLYDIQSSPLRAGRKETTMKCGRSKSGLPIFCEEGGGTSNTGEARIITGPNGERVKPLWIPRGHSNADHAGFVIHVGMCVVDAWHNRETESVKVERITRIGTADSPDEVSTELVGEWENNDGTLPPEFEAARKVALGKSHCYHCREPHYVA